MHLIELRKYKLFQPYHSTFNLLYQDTELKIQKIPYQQVLHLLTK